MKGRSTRSSFTIRGRIDTKVHNTSDLRDEVDDYDSLSKQEKLELSRSVEPEYEDTVYNVTTDALHEYFVRNLNTTDTSVEANIDASWLALGTDSATGTATSDTDLNTRTYSETVTDHSSNQKELLTSTFIDSTEANGNTFNELGLFSGDPANLANVDVFMLNHATFADVVKDNSKTITLDVTLQFSDA